MIKEGLIKIKESLGKEQEGNNKKKIENIVVFIIILVITIIVINSILNGNTKKNNSSEFNNKQNVKLATQNENISKTSINESEDKNEKLEEKLKKILKKINGVGNVEVLLTYSQSSQTIAMYNEDSTQNDTEEKDTRRTEIEK